MFAFMICAVWCRWCGQVAAGLGELRAPAVRSHECRYGCCGFMAVMACISGCLTSVFCIDVTFMAVMASQCMLREDLTSEWRGSVCCIQRCCLCPLSGSVVGAAVYGLL